MRYTIEQASDIGGVIRAARKAQQLRQDDAAGSVGVSESFMVKAERGADTVQWGKVFQILQGLGVQVVVDLPDVSGELLERQSARAEIRARRAAERLLLRADAAAPASDRRAGERTTDARVLAAARLVLAAGTAPRSARSGKRADAGASRALDIAHRVLAEAGEAPPPAARTNDGEASHD
ncbi:helix-turn-helix domain-containing protein [Burkholderia multivorans]|uniref:helix-turn-helix domain-containing protein n=1 Tax=Burkholderia multivorans TaxID=87883 RepID=UPI0007593614|nr:helix-turn-helix domain-containing protein [Burkholderia multivorans]KVS10242.1 XRE family transcriptional regulator [Burkholderia multivorans]